MTILVMCLVANVTLFLSGGNPSPRRFVAADESHGCVRYIDEADPTRSFAVPVTKPAWNLTRLAPGEYRVVGGSGYEVVRLSERRVARRFQHPALKGITALADWPDGGFIACVEAGKIVRFPRFDAAGRHVATYVCAEIFDPSNMRRTGSDELAVAWERGFVRLRVPAAVAHGTDPTTPIPLTPFADVRQPGGRNGFDAVPTRDGTGWWLTTGYSTRLCRFDNAGKLVSSWTAELGPGLKNTFYAQIQESADGLVYLAQWNGHRATDGAKGWQALAFDAQGRVAWHFHDPNMGSFDGFDLLP